MWMLYEVDVIMEKWYKNEMEMNEDAFSKFIPKKKYCWYLYYYLDLKR